MAGPVFVTARSAVDAPTLVVAVAELLPATGSVVTEVTAAVSETDEPANVAFTEPETVSVTLAPGATMPTTHVVGVQLDPVMADMVSPALGVSVNVTPVAVDGPLFVTVTV